MNHYAYGRVQRPERQATRMKCLNPYVALLGEKEGRLASRRPLEHYPIKPDGHVDEERMNVRFAPRYHFRRDWYYTPKGGSFPWIVNKTSQ
ncbi:MAG: hypothetical protein Q8P67_28420 [archaeon]|nr:hypothetical protein [archaeon]